MTEEHLRTQAVEKTHYAEALSKCTEGLYELAERQENNCKTTASALNDLRSEISQIKVMIESLSTGLQ